MESVVNISTSASRRTGAYAACLDEASAKSGPACRFDQLSSARASVAHRRNEVDSLPARASKASTSEALHARGNFSEPSSPQARMLLCRRMSWACAVHTPRPQTEPHLQKPFQGRNPVPLVTETFIAAVYTPPPARSPELRAAVAISDQLISERGKREREQYLRPIREEVQRKSGSVCPSQLNLNIVPAPE